MLQCGEGKIGGEHPQEAEQTEETEITPVFKGIRIIGARVKHVGKDDRNMGRRGRRMTVSSVLAWATVKDLALTKQNKPNRIKIGEESCRNR